MKVLKIVTLWPVIRTGLYALTWLFPPLGFVLWRMRVSKRRHRATLTAIRTPGTPQHSAAERIAGVG